MLKNYFKIAIAVLKRRKFFTFISLFGISFTLTILMVGTAFLDKIANDKYPDKKRDRSLYVNHLEEDTKQGMMSGPLSFYYLEHYVRSLKTPVKVGISSMYNTSNTYVNNKKIVINYKYTNADYWDILEYDFTEGKAITKQQIDNAEHVAVITESLKKEYFGDEGSVVGKYIEADNEKYRVCGVVKGLPVTSYLMYADMYLPYTVSKTNVLNDKGLRGGYVGIMLAANEVDVPKMQREYEDMVQRLPKAKDIVKIYSKANSYVKSYVDTGNHSSSGFMIVIYALSGFILFVMLLPTLNLVNINITRIMERSSEIGVRKAFGASSKTLVYQFIVENLILTFLGGVIGVIFSGIVIAVINRADLISNINLALNFTVLCYAILICIIFGLLSGVYPAWRMSRMKIVTALKAQ